jgi:hypothetical protein
VNLEEHPVDLGERAEFFRVCTNSVRRWIAAGVDVMDPLAVAHYLAHAKNPSPDAMSRLIEELNSPDFL